jgi:hypothetical protein
VGDADLRRDRLPLRRRSRAGLRDHRQRRKFYLRAFARTSATSLPLEVKVYHPDYGESSLALTATVPPPAPSAAAIAGIPLWVIALAGAAAAAALLFIAYWRARSAEAAAQASEWLEG